MNDKQELTRQTSSIRQQTGAMLTTPWCPRQTSSKTAMASHSMWICPVSPRKA